MKNTKHDASSSPRATPGHGVRGAGYWESTVWAGFSMRGHNQATLFESLKSYRIELSERIPMLQGAENWAGSSATGERMTA